MKTDRKRHGKENQEVITASATSNALLRRKHAVGVLYEIRSTLHAVLSEEQAPALCLAWCKAPVPSQNVVQQWHATIYGRCRLAC